MKIKVDMGSMRSIINGFASIIVVVMLLFVGFKACEARSDLVTYVFGDSLNEVGNNNFLNSLARSDYPWYGVDYNGGQPTGRFTNGRTIGDIICMYIQYNTSYFILNSLGLIECMSLLIII